MPHVLTGSPVRGETKSPVTLQRVATCTSYLIYTPLTYTLYQMQVLHPSWVLLPPDAGFKSRRVIAINALPARVPIQTTSADLSCPYVSQAGNAALVHWLMLERAAMQASTVPMGMGIPQVAQGGMQSNAPMQAPRQQPGSAFYPGMMVSNGIRAALPGGLQQPAHARAQQGIRPVLGSWSGAPGQSSLPSGPSPQWRPQGQYSNPLQGQYPPSLQGQPMQIPQIQPYQQPTPQPQQFIAPGGLPAGYIPPSTSLPLPQPGIQGMDPRVLQQPPLNGGMPQTFSASQQQIPQIRQQQPYVEKQPAPGVLAREGGSDDTSK